MSDSPQQVSVDISQLSLLPLGYPSNYQYTYIPSVADKEEIAKLKAQCRPVSDSDLVKVDQTRAEYEYRTSVERFRNAKKGINNRFKQGS